MEAEETEPSQELREKTDQSLEEERKKTDEHLEQQTREIEERTGRKSVQFNAPTSSTKSPPNPMPLNEKKKIVFGHRNVFKKN